jgi:hypothetical protein
MSSDQLLNEIERQKRYLAELPKNFSFPLFNTKRALESQRQNGYRNTAVAAREIVDNAFEAGASKVDITFETNTNGTRPIVSAVAFIDNGSGMLPTMARFALSWGGGTHFDDPNFIGKFGFGLPNASINQTKVVEVYTRTGKKDPITKAWLNLDEYNNYSQQTIPEPTTGALPDFVKKHMKKEGMEFDHGTVVVWRNPDRLTYKTARTLAEHLIDDFGVTYRYLLDDKELRVAGTKVEPVDPLFLDPRGRYFVAPAEGGAQQISTMTISAKYYRDEETGGLHLERVTDVVEIDRNDPNLLAVGSFHLRVARLPYGFAVGDKKAKDVSDEARRRFEIRQSRRGMSFVRAGREIETLDAFPRSSRDVASGLGNWPLLQSYAYHWGIEVKFGPEFDEAFGITNDKQRVRPVEDFWRLLAKEGIDALLQRENAWQEETRHRENEKRKQEKAKSSNGPSPAEEAAAAVPVVVGRKITVPDRLKPEAREHVEQEAQRRAAITKESVEEVRKSLDQEAKKRPFRVDFFDDPHGPFYRPEWIGLQIVVWVNRMHPFYSLCYGELVSLIGGYKAKQALDVLLITLAKAELEIDEEIAAQQYRHQREQVWTSFLAIALQNLAGKIQGPDEPEEGNEVTSVVAQATA